LSTGDNATFQRLWFELDLGQICFDAYSLEDTEGSRFRWYPCNSGGEFRKWYGNHAIVIDWKNNGQQIRNFGFESGRIRSAVRNESYYFRPGITWSKISSGKFAARARPSGFLFDDTGRCGFANSREVEIAALSLFCSNLADAFLKALCPTLSFTSGEIAKIPFAVHSFPHTEKIVELTKMDFDSYETSWAFSENPLISCRQSNSTLSDSFSKHQLKSVETTLSVKEMEIANNNLLINAYGLMDKISPDVPLSEITLSSNPHYRYGAGIEEEELETRMKSDTMRELISYAVGCVMGRYSLAKPGLIYAYSGGVDFDPSSYGAFPADEDGIIPITEDRWFEDDAASRIEEFLGLAWPEAPLMETLATLIDGLTMGKVAEPRDALRGYLSKQFFKDHLQTYKNRPIYWLFSSGKQKAFEALIYLHRYNEGTLARMRTNYVTPLMGKLQQRISDLEGEVASSASSAEKARKTKEKDKFGKQLVELRRFDEELRHLADQRIAIDLDDGVKVNYAKFGNLLSGVDKICGKDKDD